MFGSLHDLATHLGVGEDLPSIGFVVVGFLNLKSIKGFRMVLSRVADPDPILEGVGSGFS